LVAAVFGKKKLNVSPSKAAIQTDVEILQMLGPSRLDDVHLGLARRLETFIRKIAERVDRGESYEQFDAILDMICRHYNPGWLLLARWHMEMHTLDGYLKARGELGRFLENAPEGAEAAEAWKLMAHACFQTGDAVGEIHAFTERAQVGSVPFNDISNTANRLNQLLRERVGIGPEEKRDFARRLLAVMEKRRAEAGADDFSRMAWLAIHVGQEQRAREFATAGLAVDPGHIHCRNFLERPEKSA
jgi:hypothetical protein